MADPAVEQFHFIGKDIVTFHTLFWPAMLHFSGRKTPDQVFVHGFITRQRREDEQEPRHRHLDPLKYLELGMNPEWLRYYIAAKLNGARRGHRLQPRRLRRARQQRPGRQVHQHRQPRGGLPGKRFGGKLSADLGVEGRALLDGLRAQRATVRELYEEREFGKALREVDGCWPTASTNTSTSTSPGSWPSRPGRTRRCTTCAASASRPSAC